MDDVLEQSEFKRIPSELAAETNAIDGEGFKFTDTGTRQNISGSGTALLTRKFQQYFPG